jgi:hypothetical protein
VLAAAGVEKGDSLTALQTGSRRGAALQRVLTGTAPPSGPPPDLNGVPPCDTPPKRHRSTMPSLPPDLDLLARHQVWGLHHPIHAASALYWSLVKTASRRR